jgi:hypothetical protein
MTGDRHLQSVPGTRPENVRPLVKDQDADDGVKWLSLLLRDGLLTIVRGIETKYQIRSKQECPKCGWRS